MILDSNGEILAANIPVRKVVVDGSHVKKPGALATLAAPYLGIPRRTLLKELQTRSKYKVLLPDLGRRKGLGTATRAGGKIIARHLLSPEYRRGLIRTVRC